MSDRRCQPKSWRAALVAAILAATATADAATPDAELNADDVRAFAAARHPEAVALFREFLSLPNDAHEPADILALLDWLEPQFAERQFDPVRIETGGSPVLFAERPFPGTKGTVLIYLQADGQPVDPSRWDQPDPWTAVLKTKARDGSWRIIGWPDDLAALDPDARIFARSAADSKGPMVQFFAAIDALDAAGVRPAYDLKVIVDTEEELGSPHLPPAVENHRALLEADFLLVFDGPPHPSNRPTVSFGARGITTITLTTYGPKVPQHSGHYGNFVPNPAFALARILASLRSPDGRVPIDGFYDGVTIGSDVRELLARVPDDQSALLEAMGIAQTETVAPTLQEAIQYPSLNVRGLASGWVGSEVRTIIPATAVAEIDVRTVVETDPERLVRLIREHIANLGFTVLERAPTAAERRAHRRLVTMTHEVSYGAFRSAIDSPPGLMARAGMRRLYGEEPVLIRTLGGSVPIAPFVQTLKVPAVLIATVNADNNQHSPNENLRVGDFFEGIAIMVSVLASEARIEQHGSRPEERGRRKGMTEPPSGG